MTLHTLLLLARVTGTVCEIGVGLAVAAIWTAIAVLLVACSALHLAVRRRWVTIPPPNQIAWFGRTPWHFEPKPARRHGARTERFSHAAAA